MTRKELVVWAIERGTLIGLREAMSLVQADLACATSVNMAAAVGRIAARLPETCGWCGAAAERRAHRCEKLEKYGPDWRLDVAPLPEEEESS